MREILVSQNEKEQKLLKLLQKYFKGQADSFLYKMLRKKNILLNGKKADGKEIYSWEIPFSFISVKKAWESCFRSGRIQKRSFGRRNGRALFFMKTKTVFYSINR